MKNKIFNFGVLAAILFSLFVSVADANAQTSRRRKKTKPPTTVTTTQTPIVVSRGSDQYIDGNQIVLGEIPPTPAAGESNSQAISPPPEEARTVENGAAVDSQIKELNARIKSLESADKNDYDKKQKRLAMNLDILTKAEQRAESLRKQLFEMIEKEATVKTRLEQISFDARPEMIDRSTAFTGSLRPEEIREQRKKSLESEKRNLEVLMTQIQTSRAALEENVQKADFLVEKVRLKLDKEIERALISDEKEDQ